MCPGDGFDQTLFSLLYLHRKTLNINYPFVMKKILIAAGILILTVTAVFFLWLGEPFDPEKSPYIDQHPPENLVRTIYNSGADHYTTFLQKSADTNGEYTLIEIDLEPGGANGPHYHAQFSETFTAIEGTVGVHVNGEDHYLEEGESIVAEIGDTHYFFNNGEERVRFHVKIEPGSPGFEKGLYILYGLINHGKANEEGIPEDPLHTAVFAAYSDTRATGALRVTNPLMRRLAGRAQRSGVESELVERYYFSMTEEQTVAE